MSVRVSALCWKVPLPATTKVVLMRLADFANDAGGSIYPAVETVSKECGLSMRSVQGALRSLENDGLLVLVQSCKGGRGKTNVYRIDLAKITELVGSAAVEAAEMEASNPAVHGINPAARAGFNSGNPANPALNPAAGAQNPAPAAPNPLLTVKNPEEAPLPPQAVPAKVMNGHANGGSSVESDHAQAIVQAFDKLIVEFWGKQAARFAPADNDIDTAAKWLAHMEGDASGVIQAIDDCMADEANRGRKAPPRLSFYNGSIPRFMAAASQPVTLTAMSKPGAGQARHSGGGEALWMTVATKAAENWHDDILAELRRLGREDPDEANRYAESVRELVSRKKDRAA